MLRQSLDAAVVSRKSVKSVLERVKLIGELWLLVTVTILAAVELFSP